MSRKRAKPQPQAAKADAGTTVSLLPMEIHVRDRFTDHEFEWEVVTRPAHMHGGKHPGGPETNREMTWAAHERVEIRRAR